VPVKIYFDKNPDLISAEMMGESALIYRKRPDMRDYVTLHNEDRWLISYLHALPREIRHEANIILLEMDIRNESQIKRIKESRYGFVWNGYDRDTLLILNDRDSAAYLLGRTKYSKVVVDRDHPRLKGDSTFFGSFNFQNLKFHELRKLNCSGWYLMHLKTCPTDTWIIINAEYILTGPELDSLDVAIDNFVMILTDHLK
jgi:hypothetical protein